MQGKAWDDVIGMPIAGRESKPRLAGWTMIIDKGMSLAETDAFLSLAADYTDLIKLTFGTSAFYPRHILREKNELIRSRGISVMPGGTFAEVALVQGRWLAYVQRAIELGFDALEISDGTIHLAPDLRRTAIESARAAGLAVISEVGKKHPDDRQSLEDQAGQVRSDLDSGAAMVIVEGRESGKGVGIYGPEGQIQGDLLDALANSLPLPRVIWEAPLKIQQEELILRFGPNVNLGNIPPADVLALEALRVGLRGDTLRAALHQVAEP